jgi:exosortase
MSSARLTWTDRASAVTTPTGATLIVGVVVTALAYGPLLVEHFTNLGAKTYYQHFPFILAAFGWLIWQRFSAAHSRDLDDRSALGGPAAATLTLVAWGLLALAYAAHSPLVAYVSLIILVAAALLYATTYRRAPGLTAVWLLLWLLVPPPFNGDQKLIAYLQRLSSRASSFVLDFLGVSHLMEGNMLTLPGKQFFVDEACSGIISVMSIIACAAIYGVWRRSSAAHVVVLIAAGVAWATVMNTLRITSIAYLFDQWGVDWSEGMPHEILSLCVFMFTFLALISSDVLLRGLLAPIGSAWEEHHSEPLWWGGWLARGWDALLGHHEAEEAEIADGPAAGARPSRLQRLSWPLQVALPVAFLALPAWDFARGDQGKATVVAGAGDGEAATARALAIQKAFLPEKVGALRQVQFDIQERSREDALGNHSRSHTFVDSRGNTYLVSCDFAYEGGWHELTLCYQGVGWTLEERTARTDDPTGGDSEWPRMEADFSKDVDGGKAFVTACAFNEVGSRLEIPTWSLWENIQSVLARKREIKSGELAFQIQVWITSNEPIDESQREAARLLLAETRERFRAIVVGDAGSTPDAPGSPTAAAPTEPVAAVVDAATADIAAPDDKTSAASAATK